jgi:hypothetical protein
MNNGLPEELVRSLQRKRLWRPLNTYGLYYIAIMVGLALGYTIAEL